jgi:hypothetical protein
MRASSLHSTQIGPSILWWLRSPAVWAGLSIITMWLAVLFVGIFGGNIISSTPGGTSTSVPVVVALLPFVLPATVVAARRGFRESGGEQEDSPGERPQVSPPDATTESAQLRSKAA